MGGRDLDKFRKKERLREEGDAQSLQGLLGNYLQRSSLGQALLVTSPAFRQAWAEVAGPLGERCLPMRWENGVLWVEVSDPGWKFELRWKLPDLARALRERGQDVRQIRIR